MSRLRQVMRFKIGKGRVLGDVLAGEMHISRTDLLI